MSGGKWQEGSALDNATKIATIIGFQNAPLAFALGEVNWESAQERDEFAYALVEKPVIQ